MAQKYESDKKSTYCRGYIQRVSGPFPGSVSGDVLESRSFRSWTG